MKISGIKKLFSKANFKMFVKFGCVGVINTIIDTAVFFVLCDIIGVWEIVSNCAAYIVSATNSYFMNSRFVYRDRKYSLKKYFGFLLGNVFVLIVSSLSLAVLSRFFSVKTVAKLITVPITVVLNFGFQRFILFKESADKLD